MSQKSIFIDISQSFISDSVSPDLARISSRKRLKSDQPEITTIMQPTARQGLAKAARRVKLSVRDEAIRRLIILNLVFNSWRSKALGSTEPLIHYFLKSHNTSC